jgi:predicted hydrocarbon binding protein
VQRSRSLRPGLNHSEGTITGAMTNDRLLVLPVRFWTQAKRFLEEAYGESVSVVLNRVAQEVGRSYGSILKENGYAPAEAFEALAEMASVAGWGKVEFGGDVRGGSRISVDIINCAFCSAEGARSGTRCDFMAGVAEGVAGATYGHEYSGAHMDVGGGAERKCSLLICKTDRAGGDWKPAVFFPWLMSEELRA